LKAYPAVWTFAWRAGVEPTNNVAERARRPAVLWRRSFGRRSTAGRQYVEWIPSVALMLRQCGRTVLGYPADALVMITTTYRPPELFAACGSVIGQFG
jgi:transposase